MQKFKLPQNEHTPPRAHINFEMHTLSVIVIVSIFSLVEASWPDGTYCLPMPPNQKCPSGWQKGVRKHDTEDYQGSMHCHKKRQGWVPYNVDLCRNLGWGFCCKTRNYFRTGKTWPRGAYCIFRKGGTCPKGFDSGYIHWDDEDTRNANKRSGVLPDGSYGRNTKIYFCCRDDRLIFQLNILIGLPKCSQMILMRYKGTCPRMLFGYRGHHTGFLQWDTEDRRNADQRVGAYPDGQKTFGSGIKIEFCSFTSGYSC